MAQRRGDAAKSAVIETILNNFEDAFLLDKKIYVNMKDGPSGEIVQIAISLTMPKVAVAAGAAQKPVVSSSTAAWDLPPADLSPEDKAKVENLCEKLNLWTDSCK